MGSSIELSRPVGREPIGMGPRTPELGSNHHHHPPKKDRKKVNKVPLYIRPLTQFLSHSKGVIYAYRSAYGLGTLCCDPLLQTAGLRDLLQKQEPREKT